VFVSQSLLSWYVANLFKGSLLYGSLSTVVIFLLWINILFLILLGGARMIYRLSKNS